MFGGAIRLFRIFGIPIQLDITFLLVLPLFTIMIANGIRAGREPFGLEFDIGPLQQGITPYALGLMIVIGLFISVLIHELGHALTARGYGVRTRGITLWLLGGVAQLESMPRQRGGEAVVAIVGPIVSFALAGAFWGLLQLIPAEANAARYVVTYLVSINLALAIFNLLPALPLDGGRVLRSLLALRLNPLQATRIVGGMSKVLAVALGLVGFFVLKDMWLLLIAFFIYMAVNAETQQSVMEYVLRGLKVRDLMNPDVVTIEPNTTVHELMGTMVRERHLGFPVQENGNLVGIVDLHDAQGVPPETAVSQIMRPQPRVISESAPALQAFERMARSGFERLIVVGAGGRMVGIITKTDLMRAIQIRLAATSPRNTVGLREYADEDQIDPARTMP